MFNGTDGYIDVPDSPGFHTAAVTVAIWARANSMTGTKAGGCVGEYIFFKRNSRGSNFEGHKVSFEGAGPPLIANVTVASSGGVQVGTGAGLPAMNTWVHLVYTANATFISLFVNGELKKSALTGFPLDIGTRPLFFGRSGEWFDGFLNGAIDDIKIYNRVLSPGEIQTLTESQD